MTWREWQAARQLLAEETVGVNARQVRQGEDDAFRKSAQALQRMK